MNKITSCRTDNCECVGGARDCCRGFGGPRRPDDSFPVPRPAQPRPRPHPAPRLQSQSGSVRHHRGAGPVKSGEIGNNSLVEKYLEISQHIRPTCQWPGQLHWTRRLHSHLAGHCCSSGPVGSNHRISRFCGIANNLSGVSLATADPLQQLNRDRVYL